MYTTLNSPKNVHLIALRARIMPTIIYKPRSLASLPGDSYHILHDLGLLPHIWSTATHCSLLETYCYYPRESIPTSWYHELLRRISFTHFPELTEYGGVQTILQ